MVRCPCTLYRAKEDSSYVRLASLVSDLETLNNALRLFVVWDEYEIPLNNKNCPATTSDLDLLQSVISQLTPEFDPQWMLDPMKKALRDTNDKARDPFELNGDCITPHGPLTAASQDPKALPHMPYLSFPLYAPRPEFLRSGIWKMVKGMELLYVLPLPAVTHLTMPYLTPFVASLQPFSADCPQQYFLNGSPPSPYGRSERCMVVNTQDTFSYPNTSTIFLPTHFQKAQTVRDEIAAKATAAASGKLYQVPESKLLLVLRINGIYQVSPKAHKALVFLRLLQINSAVFVRVNKATMNMTICRPWITYGEPTVETIRALINKRGVMRTGVTGVFKK